MPDKRESLKNELASLVRRGEGILESEKQAIAIERAAEESRFGDTYKERPPEDRSEPSPRGAVYPDFVEDYQRWYSLALPVVAQVLPERAAEFAEFYEGPRQVEGGVRRYIRERESQDALESMLEGDRTEAFRRAMSQQVFLLKAAGDRLDSILPDIRGVLEAEIFDTTLAGAEELFAKKHLRAAGVVAGVVLETHLKDVCRNHNVKLRKQKPTIGDLNDALKNEGVYDMVPWRRVQHLANIRNVCGHDREREPTRDEVDDLLRGVAWAVKTLF